ncbi:uncharacterized protein LOC114315043 [Camellia sinensis]|uniref:uncharacterized protein LOC114315043 n=1 Tax=Camellia sinensis TaxID=4442 RepID=UPI001035E5C6|nr:uncharacterized protein LOC114315043 [Camellia sinensis]
MGEVKQRKKLVRMKRTSIASRNSTELQRKGSGGRREQRSCAWGEIGVVSKIGATRVNSKIKFKWEHLVKKSWEESALSGWAGFVIMHKLKMLRVDLKKWNREVFGNVTSALKLAEEELHAIDLVAESRNLEENEVQRRREVRKEVWSLAKREEWMRFSEEWTSRPKLKGLFRTIGHDEVSDGLVAPFSKEEIWRAVKESDGNKAPGPDGFNMACFQKCWKVFKKEILQFFNEFYDNGRLAKGINSSFTTLIPKKDCPEGISNYRPISLVGSIYKILSKVLASRLKKVLQRIIGDSQTAFIGRRNILDGVLISNEIVDWWKKKKKQKGMILKLDFEKAFNSVNWECLFEMLSSFGFQNKWTRWIKECLQSSRVSILVNGSPTAEFCPENGLRQGDPLSPFLFIIVAEGLNMLFQRAKDLGLINGVVIGTRRINVTHLQFTDDIIVFYEAEEQEILNVKRILRCFEVLSGLWIKFHKTKLLDRIQARFFWGGLETKKKLHMVRWDEITKKKWCGGLGIRRLRDVNECLLAKWWWRYGGEDQALCKDVVTSKYSSFGGRWRPFLVDDIQCSRIWGDILSLEHISPNLFNFFMENSVIKVANRRRISFWEDHWASNCSLRVEFPRFFELSDDK